MKKVNKFNEMCIGKADSNFFSASYIQELALLLSQMNPLKFTVNENFSRFYMNFYLFLFFLSMNIYIIFNTIQRERIKWDLLCFFKIYYTYYIVVIFAILLQHTGASACLLCRCIVLQKIISAGKIQTSLLMDTYRKDRGFFWCLV